MHAKISVIIPTYNRGPLIRQCIDAVLAQEGVQEFEVIVVNDGSTDDTANILEEYQQIRVLTQINAGPAAARNHGVDQARGEIVVFTDDDCIPAPDWLQKMIEPFSDPEIAGTKGAYLTRQSELVARFVQIEYEEKYDELRRHKYIDFVDTYSAAFRRDVFLQVGGYDTKFHTASVEDQDFSFRVVNAGYKIVFVPEARVWHRHVEDLSSYCRKKYKIGFWKVLVLSKNPNKITGDTHTPATLKLQVALAAGIPVAALAGMLLPGLIAIPLVLALLFLLSSIPLILRCARQDLPVALMAPIYIGARAVCLAWGLIRASIYKLLGDQRFRPGSQIAP